MDTRSLPAQRFTVSHLNEADFKADGLRPYSAYRDLGIAAATQGLAVAHVIRMTEPYSEKYRQRHHHDVQFQLVYVLKGWFKSEFESAGVHVMKVGSCWIQPSGIRHTVLGWSDDCELFEIVLLAEFVMVNDL